MSYVEKEEWQLVYEDNRDHIRTQAGLVLRRLKRRLENQAIANMSKAFNEARANGEMLRLGMSSDEVTLLVAGAASQLAIEVNGSSES